MYTDAYLMIFQFRMSKTLLLIMTKQLGRLAMWLSLTIAFDFRHRQRFSIQLKLKKKFENKKSTLPWRLFSTACGYQRNDKAWTFAAIPRIHVTPITDAILTQIKAAPVLCCWLVTLCVLCNISSVHFFFHYILCLRSLFIQLTINIANNKFNYS